MQACFFKQVLDFLTGLQYIMSIPAGSVLSASRAAKGKPEAAFALCAKPKCRPWSRLQLVWWARFALPPYALPIDFAAMTDRHDQHNEAVVLDRGDDPVVAHPIAPETLEVAG